MDHTNIKRDRGRRLAVARNRAGLTADELIRRLAVATRGRMDFTSSAVYAWEAGRNLLQDNVATQLASILGCPVIDLLGPSQPNELELISLGGSLAAEQQETRTAPNLREEFDVELTLRSRTSGSVVRRRSWRLAIDVDKSEIVVRAGEGCSSESLKLFRPTPDGCEELKGKPDYRDLGALRIPFDIPDDSSDEDAPVLFLQQALEAIPLFKNELPSQVETRDESVSNPLVRRRLSKDIQFELADFLDDKTAQRLSALWEESSDIGEHLQHYCERILPQERDPYKQRLQEALIFTSLLKDHERARRAIDLLSVLAGDDPRRVTDAAYLSGRNRWYLGVDKKDNSQLPQAIDDLTRALQHAQIVQDSIRMGQAFVYLARIGLEHANYRQLIKEKTAYDAIQLGDMAKEIGRQHGRPDMELLAERLHVIRLYNEKEYDECIARGKQLLARLQADSVGEFDFRNIESNLAVHVGLALRRRNNVGDREEAERIYLDAIGRGRNDSHAGMATYLLGDIYADRMLDSMSAAATATSELQKADELQTAERCRITAQEWYDQAANALRDRGDRKAFSKAVYRTIWIRSGVHSSEFPKPTTRQLVAMSHAAREQFINQRLIGAKFSEQTRALPVEFIREILTVRNLDIETDQDKLPSIPVSEYVDSDTLLVFPRNLGATLMVQFLALDSESDKNLTIKGWVAIRSYSSEIIPLLRQLQQEAARPVWSEKERLTFQEHERQCWFALLDRIEVIEPLRFPSAKRLVVIAPDDHADALLPFEALIENESAHTKVLESITESVVYAGPWGSPLKTARTVIRPEEIAVFADHTELSSSRGRAESLDTIIARETRFRPNHLPKSGAVLSNNAVAIVAHADSAGKLRDRVRSWRFDGVRAVFLLFCDSGVFDLISGPFSDGVAQRIRRQLGSDGIVVSTRLPISVAEALRLLRTIERDATSDRPVANLITEYMRDRLAQSENPLTFPWLMI